MMLTPQEHARLRELLKPYKKNKQVKRMKQYIQHGKVSTYQHCINVARVSFWINRRFSLGANEAVLITGALLHDFYLYDWHIPAAWHRLHGFSHAELACQNAIKYFHINKETQKVIRCHMWPLNITRFPWGREAAIVCIADKYCSFLETILRLTKNAGRSVCG